MTKTNLFEAIVDGASQRIRPMLMTSLASFIGLLPILWSTGAGADVMKRIAAPMVGGHSLFAIHRLAGFSGNLFLLERAHCY